ncbi:MAG TPA: aspartyl protease family protein [Pyrinomonadaceae bacterium]|nr:aspartyl protease family protein [Pyrinomonadaceae bacterium]
MKIIAIRMLLINALLCVSATAVPAVTDSDSEIPFTFEKGHVIVSAKINGDTPVEVVLSTGAEYSLINALLLDKYKLKGAYTGEGIITGGDLDRVVVFVPVSDIHVGDVKLTSLNMRYGQAPTEITQRLGREIFAVLGADFFKGRVVQFDFRRKVIRFLAHSLDSTPQNKDASRFATLSIRPSDESIRPIVENVTFNGMKIKTLFDTGALTVVSLTPSAAKQIGLTPPPDKSPPRADKVSLKFGEIGFTDLPVTLYAKGSVFDRTSSGYGAVVGIALLQNFILTFDFHRGLVTLEHV